MRVVAAQNLDREAAGEAEAALRARRFAMDAIVVVGAKRSCTKCARPVIHVRGPDDLDPAWFLCCTTVGLFAAPHAERRAFDAVRRRLEAMA